MMQKTALFLACGILYEDKWPSVREPLLSLAAKLKAAGYRLKEDFFLHEIECADAMIRYASPLIEIYEEPLLNGAERGCLYYCNLFRIMGAGRVIALCDLSKDNQVDILRAILSACETHQITLTPVLYDADDWLS